MLHTHRRRLLFALVVAAIALPRAAHAFTQITRFVPPPQAVQSARTSVVRIESDRNDRPPFATASEEGFGSGAGFIIDAEGHVLTNAHVVNGGANLRVFFDGSIEPIQATLLGVAECADLAVLDLEGDGYEALTWSEAPAGPGNPVFAIGYPDDAFDAVVTRGAVLSVATDNPTEWASIQTAIRHSAELGPGNSGGPLLNASGLVVGVTYAQGAVGRRGYAIAAVDALPIVGALSAGQNVDSIGVSGTAFYEDADLNGLWVSAVQPGSPADLAGILPGDIIRTLEGERVGADGTLGAFCEVLRQAPDNAALEVEVLRPDADALLRGELGGAPLTVTEAIGALTLPKPVAQPTPTPAPTPLPSDFQTHFDETGLIALQTPRTWSYVASDPSRLGSITLSPQIVIARERRSYLSGRATSSVLAWVEPSDPAGRPINIADQPLEEIRCAASTLEDYQDDDWHGQVRQWSGCKEPGDPLYIVASLTPVDGETVVVSIVLYIPAGEPHFSLETLIAPLAETLLPQVPFWQPPRATVLAGNLNVRSGPGTGYEILTVLQGGEEIPVIGKDGPDCEWVYFYFSNLEGWVSANPIYLGLDRDCAELAVMDGVTFAELRRLAP